MKKLLIPVAAIVLAVAGLSACKKIVSTIFKGTDITIPPTTVTVPAVLIVSPVEQSLGSFTQEINIDSIIRANTAGLFGVNAVSTIKIKQVTVNVLNADASNNLSSFETVRVNLSSNSNSNRVELFNVTIPEQATNTYSFTPSSTPELLPYLKGTTLSYAVSGNNRRTTSKPLHMEVRVVLRAN